MDATIEITGANAGLLMRSVIGEHEFEEMMTPIWEATQACMPLSLRDWRRLFKGIAEFVLEDESTRLAFALWNWQTPGTKAALAMHNPPEGT